MSVEQHAGLTDWIERYERAWRTAGTAPLAELFTDDVRYSVSPWQPPIVGLAALTAFWDAERDGPDEAFTFDAQVVAVDGDAGTGVARVEVHYGGGQAWRDLWIVQLTSDGRCRAFEEWPFAPGQDDGH